ncbi:hypothetical protein [Acidicapsa ligni]|uniref:hypothetical protein n=1 Tax=Acidicapsa ligni TaxID=542300 RepID=UPI0021E00C9C|nr:hypothetical protein [Acidicapsa ligni]
MQKAAVQATRVAEFDQDEVATSWPVTEYVEYDSFDSPLLTDELYDLPGGASPSGDTDTRKRDRTASVLS